MFTMNKYVFYRLSNDLQTNYGLKGSRRMYATEILGMFLHMLGHGVKNRLAQKRFQHSGETVSRYFGAMLDIVCKMTIDIIKPMDSEFRGIPQEIRRDARYMSHLKDCIGAIDGVHVEASIPPSDQVTYISRKGMPTQNVMVACNFDMQFTFAYAGWEVTAHDTKVFLSVLRNPNLYFSKPRNGKYYLVDAGYLQMIGYLGPYKGERYHLPDCRKNPEPTGHKEVFNHMHSSLRSIIEQTFFSRSTFTKKFTKRSTTLFHNYLFS
ncbi:uncharacterized protein LOC126625017 [Malus sylvestris]|uniref:uncharacterized protein LOC126625017 n=1 Tax=Malus sylvestris TaxID=3752 RepID=UPI0021ABF9A9|nr:uncharacterized protein LOC126625017 [Malus sylvestris]